MSLSQSVIVGNLTDDPEVRYTPAGRATAKCGVAVNRRYTPAGATEPVESVSFFNVQLWGDLAENAAESLRKGHRVIVAGRLDQRSWETPEGEKRYAVEIVADSIGPDLRFATAHVAKIERALASATA